MITLSIRYTIDPRKRSDFEQYARALCGIIPRCGGDLVGYWLPTKFAGPTNLALALIDFPSLAAYSSIASGSRKTTTTSTASGAPRRAAASSSRTAPSSSASSGVAPRRDLGRGGDDAVALDQLTRDPDRAHVSGRRGSPLGARRS